MAAEVEEDDLLLVPLLALKGEVYRPLDRVVRLRGGNDSLGLRR